MQDSAWFTATFDRQGYAFLYIVPRDCNCCQRLTAKVYIVARDSSNTSDHGMWCI